MPAKIPQNVEREDRIVGPLTLKQLLWVLGGAGVIIGVIRYWTAGYLYTIEMILVSFIVGVLALLFAFFRYNERDFLGFLLSLIRYFASPKRLIWAKEVAEETKGLLVIPPAKEKAKRRKEEVGEVRSELEKLSHILDSGGAVTAEEREGIAGRIAALPATPSEEIERTESLEDVLEKTER